MTTKTFSEQLAGRGRKAMTIGAVCKQLKREFADVSISKIRYLEDQQLLTPRRTQGGYRLYSPADVSRLRTILLLQRDEFLPLRVIRQELASGRAADDAVGDEREAALLEQMLGAALRSPNKEKRREAVESLESLVAVVTRLQQLLLVRDLRRLVD